MKNAGLLLLLFGMALVGCSTSDPEATNPASTDRRNANPSADGGAVTTPQELAMEIIGVGRELGYLTNVNEAGLLGYSYGCDGDLGLRISADTGQSSDSSPVDTWFGLQAGKPGAYGVTIWLGSQQPLDNLLHLDDIVERMPNLKVLYVGAFDEDDLAAVLDAAGSGDLQTSKREAFESRPADEREAIMESARKVVKRWVDDITAVRGSCKDGSEYGEISHPDLDQSGGSGATTPPSTVSSIPYSDDIGDPNSAQPPDPDGPASNMGGYTISQCREQDLRGIGKDGALEQAANCFMLAALAGDRELAKKFADPPAVEDLFAYVSPGDPWTFDECGRDGGGGWGGFSCTFSMPPQLFKMLPIAYDDVSVIGSIEIAG